MGGRPHGRFPLTVTVPATGLWATYSAAPHDNGGWTVTMTDPADQFTLPPHLATEPGRVLVDDTAVLTGWTDGAERFRWVFNEPAAAEYEVPSGRQDAAATAAAIAAWSGAPAARLEPLWFEVDKDPFAVMNGRGGELPTGSKALLARPAGRSSGSRSGPGRAGKQPVRRLVPSRR